MATAQPRSQTTVEVTVTDRTGTTTGTAAPAVGDARPGVAAEPPPRPTRDYRPKVTRGL